MVEIEELVCPTCKKAMRLLARGEKGKWEVRDCRNCGLFEVLRDKKGEAIEFHPVEYDDFSDAIRYGVYEKVQKRISKLEEEG